MRKALTFFGLLLLSLQLLSSELTEYLSRQPKVERIETVENHPFFLESVVIRLRQPLDHRRPELGSFLQRVFISILQPGSPVVFITEGYMANYAASPKYINELSSLLEANQVCVEHRYFGESWPEPIDWEHLTVENAAGDHHQVVQLLKPFLTGKWIGTGISKGGQTALLHRVFYPGDVDGTVSFVAPLNFGVEDGRHGPFIASVPGTPAERKKVRDFQKQALMRRKRLMPLFEEFIHSKNLTFRAPHEHIFDYSVLEYSFSFWQHGSNPAAIPGKKASDTEVYDHLIKEASPEYFSIEGQHEIRSFFVQAARELGYYGYDTRPFSHLLTIPTAKAYLHNLFLPEGVSFKFDETSAVRSQQFLDTTRLPMIFIYGEYDPWSASGVSLPPNTSLLKIVHRGGSHRTRIAHLGEADKKQVLDRLTQWTAIPEGKPNE